MVSSFSPRNGATGCGSMQPVQVRPHPRAAFRPRGPAQEVHSPYFPIPTSESSTTSTVSGNPLTFILPDSGGNTRDDGAAFQRACPLAANYRSQWHHRNPSTSHHCSFTLPEPPAFLFSPPSPSFCHLRRFSWDTILECFRFC